MLELGKEGISRRALFDEGRIAETKMDGGRAGDSFKGPIKRLDANLSGFVRPGLHIGLINLNDRRAGGEEVFDLLIDRCGVVHRQPHLVLVVIVLRLHRHGERTWHRDLDGPVGIGTQELYVACLDGVFAAHGADDARYRLSSSRRAGRCLSRIVDIDAIERRGKAVG